EGVAKALIQSDALKVYVCNVATQPGETDGYDVRAHVNALARHLPGGANPLDVVIATTNTPDAVSPASDVALVTAAPDPTSRPRVVVDDVVRVDNPLRHDPDKLAAVLMHVYEEQRHVRPVPNGTMRAAS